MNAVEAQIFNNQFANDATQLKSMVTLFEQL